MTGLAVIFDLDGLLVDTEPLWTESARRLLARRDRAYDPALKPFVMGRHPLEVATRMVAHYDLEETPQALLAERLAIMREIYQEEALTPLPGARELVEALAGEGIPRAVASGSPTDLIDSVLHRVGLRERFAILVGSDRVQHGKPAPDCFLLTAELLGHSPASCLVLEDSPAGVSAALAAGMCCVAVPGPEIARRAVAAAHLVAGSLRELSPALLGQLVASSPRGSR